MKIAILMPSKGRPKQLERNVSNLLMQPLPSVVSALMLILAIEADDIQTVSVARKLQTTWRDSDATVSIVYRDQGTTCVDGLNLAYQRARHSADWYVLGSDDQVYQDGWLFQALLVARATGAQVVGLNDGHTSLDEFAPHYMASADFIETQLGGWMVPPLYQSWWFDREICEKAQALAVYTPAWLAHVDHLHPDWGTALMDDTYRDAWPAHDRDKALYLKRKEMGFPLDYIEVEL